MGIDAPLLQGFAMYARFSVLFLLNGHFGVLCSLEPGTSIPTQQQARTCLKQQLAASKHTRLSMPSATLYRTPSPTPEPVNAVSHSLTGCLVTTAKSAGS